MTGLLLIVLVIVWMAIAFALARAFTRGIKAGVRRAAVGVFVFALLLPLPVVDEIIGGFQLRALCREGAVALYDEEKLRGRTVRMRLEPNPDVPSVMQTPTRRVGALLPIDERTIDYLDTESAQTLLSYKAFTAKGGVLIRMLGISNADSPLTIDPSSCAVNPGPIFQRLGVKSD
jgi:hypothetical protein